MTFTYKTRLLALFLSIVLSATSITPVLADKKKDTLENELSNLNKELNTLSSELNNIISKTKKSTEQLQKLKGELAIAQGKEEALYDSMKARIKYMYENGNASFLEIILSSRSMADFIGKYEMVSAITAYDQDSLQKLINTREEINTKTAQLKADQKQLTELKKALSEKEAALKKKISSTSGELTDYKKQLTNAQKESQNAQNALDKVIIPISPDIGDKPSGGSSSSTGTVIEISAKDLEFFAAVIECEAGSTHYEGMLAVASVVVNRMKHPNYPDTIRGVLEQKGQFPPAVNGKAAKKIARGVKASCVQVAKDALSGKNNVGGCLRFNAASTGRPGTIIGSNVFF